MVSHPVQRFAVWFGGSVLSSTPEFFAVCKRTFYRFKLQKQAVYAVHVGLKLVIKRLVTGLEINLDSRKTSWLERFDVFLVQSCRTKEEYEECGASICRTNPVFKGMY